MAKKKEEKVRWLRTFELEAYGQVAYQLRSAARLAMEGMEKVLADPEMGVEHRTLYLQHGVNEIRRVFAMIEMPEEGF